MAEPTPKSPQINGLLDALIGQPQGRVSSIKADCCVPAPIGCGKPVGEFRDEISRREYRISGLCQTCQDKFFGG